MYPFEEASVNITDTKIVPHCYPLKKREPSHTWHRMATNGDWSPRVTKWQSIPCLYTSRRNVTSQLSLLTI